MDKDQSRLKELMEKQEHSLLDEKEQLELSDLMAEFGPQVLERLKRSSEELLDED